ncbi:MAG: DUF2834 domain-containing protein [Alphaproteobacteria bacterium]
MTLRNLYLALTLLGFVAPLTYFGPWLAEHGMNFGLLGAAFSGNEVAIAAMIDLSLAAIVACIFYVAEGLRQGIKLWWLAILGTFTIGLCFSLPLFLYLRERNAG